MDSEWDSLIGRMTLEEKVGLCSGETLWTSTPVPRLGIPAFKMSDGPNGVRGDSLLPGIRSTCFPVGSALGASWDVELIAEVGRALAAECRDKDVDVLLGPTINLHRTPLAGRNFECYSEDPHLTAELAIAYTRAVQGAGVAVCLKHFACNESEFHRHSMSSVVDPRTLRELYLLPFERAIREAGAWTVMSAYNRLNGVYCSSSKALLGDVLKGEWGFDGVVISDWGGTYATVPPALAGLDLEMPGPGQHLGSKLLDAVRRGLVAESVLDDKVRRQLRLMQRTGRLDRPQHEAERSSESPEHRALAERAAVAGMVLLKNDGHTLPLSDAQALAVIGPNAVAPQIQGGGSSRVNAHSPGRIDEAIARAFPGSRVALHEGCRAHRHLPLLEPGGMPAKGRAGWEAHFFAGFEFAGEPVATTHPKRSELTFFGRFNDAVPDDFCARLTTTFTAAMTGRHQLSLISAGLSRLYVDDTLLVDNWEQWRQGNTYYGAGSEEAIAEFELAAGQSVRIRVEYSRETRPRLGGVRVGLLEPEPEDLMASAVQAASEADAAVLVVGLNGEWETEGSDRVDMRLPGRQVELIRRVSAVNPRTVVVINAGSPVLMGDWIHGVRAVLQVWYPGEGFAAALAAVLAGLAEPGGRLPTTFPDRYEDHPALFNYPGELGEVRYGEGLYMGYRGYDARNLAPAFPFGHGLGYTTFELVETAAAEAVDGALHWTMRLRNTGLRSGSTVVQVYVAAPGSMLQRPPKTLCAFRKLTLDAGAEAEIAFSIPLASIACFDPRAGAFRIEAGRHRLLAGFSAGELRLTTDVDIAGDSCPA